MSIGLSLYDMMCSKDFFNATAKAVLKKEDGNFQFGKANKDYYWLITNMYDATLEIDLIDRDKSILMHVNKNHKSGKDMKFPLTDDFEEDYDEMLDYIFRFLMNEFSAEWYESNMSVKKSLQEGIDIKIVYCDDTPSEYIDDVTMNDIYDILDSSSDICKIVDVSGSKKKVVWTDEYGFERAYESKKCIKKSMKEGIQKKDWENWKIDSIGGTVFEYYFNGHNEKENVIQSLIEDDYPTIKIDYGEILDTLNKEFRGKTLGDMQKKGYILPWGKDVDLGIHFNYEIEKLNTVSNGNSGMVELHCDFYIPSTDEVYNFGCHAFVYVDDLDVSMFLENKKSARKSIKESVKPEIQLMVNNIIDELIGEYSSKEWDAFSSNEKFDIVRTEYFSFGYKSKYLSEVRDLVIENMNHPFNVVFESKKSMKKSLKESKDSDFFNGIAKEYHFSKDEKTRYKDKTHISAIGVLFDRINDAIKIYGRNSDEEYNALNDCWSVITSAKQNGWNVDYEEDKWNKITGLPNYH